MVALLPPGPRGRYPGHLILAFRRDPLGFLARLVREFGDVAHFRAGRVDYYLLSDPADIHRALVTDAANFVKGPALQRARVTLGDGLLTSEGQLHDHQRRLVQPVFHPHHIGGYIPIMIKHAVAFRDRWLNGAVIDIHEQMMELTLSIVAEALFGADVHRRLKELGQAINVTVRMFNRAMMPWSGLLELLPLPSNRRFIRARQFLMDTIQEMIDRRKSHPEQRDDLLSVLLQASHREFGEELTDEQLRDHAITVFLAGHETTANALTFTWYLLAQHPDADAALQDEVATVLAGRLPSAEDLPRLTCTRAVVSEAMRLYPPVWIIGRRALDDWPIGPYMVPAGSVVLMSQHVVHRDERFWPDPLRFDPQRWLGKQDRPRYAYFPFGGGPRSCIGEPLAWTEAVLLLATLAQRWRLELAETEPIQLEPTITLRPRNGIQMIPRRR